MTRFSLGHGPRLYFRAMTQQTDEPPTAAVLSVKPSWRPTVFSLAALLVFAVVDLRWQGRVWWCQLGDRSPFSSAVDAHNSQHLLDPYTPSHILHGVIFYGLFWLCRRQMGEPWRFFWSILMETAWEMFENSPVVIDRYRTATVSLGYTGDSIANSMSDIAAAAIGYYIAKCVGLWWSVALFFTFELGTLFWIRDNLTLNIIMLLWPVRAIKTWQGGG